LIGLLCGDFDAGEEDDWRHALAAALPEAPLLSLQEARRAPADVQFALVANPAPGALQGWPQLRLIQSLWAGVDRLLADASLPTGVPLARMVDPAMNSAMAETALWATLSLQRGFYRYAAQQRAGLWRTHAQRRAQDLRVTVLGQGQMGRTAAAVLARQGYAVQGWRRDGTPLVPLLAASDVVINLLPLTPETRGLIDVGFLAALPSGAALVNLARGAHVVDAALLAALDSGHLAHAVLDVFHTEPLPAGHPYWQHPRVTVLPHAAAFTDPRSAAVVAAANVRCLLGTGAAAAGSDGVLGGLTGLVDRSRGY
jgi:glyoxylate/hydroxypyruvate reductase